MLKKCAVLFLLIITYLNAQAVLSFSEQSDNGKTYWIINGEINLPDRNMVSLKINFGDGMIPRSNKVLYVKKSSFTYKYTLGKGRVLPGKYTASFVYNDSGNTIEQLYDFYIGNFYQEQVERSEYKTYFKKTLAEIKAFQEKVKKETNEFLLLKNVKNDSVISWIRGSQQQIGDWQDICGKRMYPNTLAPYSQGNMTRLQQIISYVETIISHYSVEVLLSAQITKDKKGLLSKKQVEVYQENITQLMKEVEETEQFSAYLNEESLVSDLTIFQNIFVNITKSYEVSLQQFNKEFWNKKHAEFEEQVLMFSSRIDEYSESPLSKKHQKLCANLASLLVTLEMLEDCYSKNLYERAGINHDIVVKQNEIALQEKIKDQFAKVYKVVESHFSVKQKQKIDLIELMTKSLSQVREVQNELKQNYTEYIKQSQNDALDQEKFNEWQKTWKKNLGELQANLYVLYTKKEENIFEKFPMNWLFFISYLQNTEKLYLALLSKQQDLEAMIKINSYHVKIENEISNLTKRMETLK